MKRLTASLMAVMLLGSATPAPCTDHLVSQDLIEVRLREASQQRAGDIATLRSFLSGPTARRAAATVHLKPNAVAGTRAREALRHLSTIGAKRTARWLTAALAAPADRSGLEDLDQQFLAKPEDLASLVMAYIEKIG